MTRTRGRDSDKGDVTRTRGDVTRRLRARADRSPHAARRETGTAPQPSTSCAPRPLLDHKQRALVFLFGACAYRRRRGRHTDAARQRPSGPYTMPALARRRDMCSVSTAYTPHAPPVGAGPGSGTTPARCTATTPRVGVGLRGSLRDARRGWWVWPRGEARDSLVWARHETGTRAGMGRWQAGASTG